MNRIVWMCAAVALASCDPKPKGVTTVPGPGSGSGSGVATLPVLDRVICAPVHATTVSLPGGVEFLRGGGQWMMRLDLNCGFDRDLLSQTVIGCTTQSACGALLDARRLAALNAELGSARQVRATVGGVQLDAFLLAGSTLYSARSAHDLMTVARNLRAGLPAPGPGGGGPVPTGGRAAASAAEDVSIPCCPGCGGGRCIPADCETTPSNPPRVVFDDGCDAAICTAFASPPDNCDCYRDHCHP